MFNWLRVPKFQDRLRPESDNAVALEESVISVQELDERLTEQCAPRTKWFQTCPDALKAGESLAAAIERLYNSNRDEAWGEAHRYEDNEPPREWEYVPYSAMDAPYDEDGDRGESIETSGAYDTDRWQCPIPIGLFKVMVKVAREENCACKSCPVSEDLLAGIDWEWWKLTKGRKTVEQDREGIPKGFSAFENPGLVGEIVKRSAVGKTGDFVQGEMDLQPDVMAALDASQGKTLTQIHREVCMTDTPEGKHLRSRESVLYRIRCWIGMKIALLATKVVPAKKLEEIRYQEEEA
jgi:hypothetical protein